MQNVAAAALVAAAAFGGAGCGGEPSAGSPPGGQAIFARECSSCHTLTGREHGTVGGDLARTGLSAAAIASFAKVMPVPTPLSRAEASAVAEYVHARERTRR